MDSDPIALFDAWFAEARESEPNDPEAMALATADAEGRPSVRMVLLKNFSLHGFTFFTNLESRKGEELTQNARAALLFHWKSLRRQIRIEGPVHFVTNDEADAYFSSRPRDARIGAWASDQSRMMETREAFERRIAEITERYQGEDVPRPPHWSGYRVNPERMEFWSDRPFRLHERRLFTRKDGGWSESLLYP